MLQAGPLANYGFTLFQALDTFVCAHTRAASGAGAYARFSCHIPKEHNVFSEKYPSKAVQIEAQVPRRETMTQLSAQV